MNDDDDRDSKPANDFLEMQAMFEASAAAAAEHAATCRAVPCPRCGRYECRGCGEGFGADGGVEDLCNGCRTKTFRKTWTTPALLTIPKDFQGTTLDEEWLSRLVGHQTITRARNALSAPRAAFVGPPGAGKTQLAIAMFRAAVLADAPTPRRDWSPLVTRRGFGAGHLYISAFALAKARTTAPLGREAEEVERALRAPLVVIDELGGEDPRYASAVTEVIYERHAEGRATWITTGVGAREIANRYGGGIARRAFEDATLFELGKVRP